MGDDTELLHNYRISLSTHHLPGGDSAVFRVNKSEYINYNRAEDWTGQAEKYELNTVSAWLWLQARSLLLAIFLTILTGVIQENFRNFINTCSPPSARIFTC